MAIFELRTMRGWSQAETARLFFVTDDTMRAWLRRVIEFRPHAALSGKTPENDYFSRSM